MYIKTANGCAWRAFYVISGPRNSYGPLRFSLGFDPGQCGNNAKLFGCIGYLKDCQGTRKATWQWRLKLPRWRHWWRLDGRLAFDPRKGLFGNKRGCYR